MGLLLLGACSPQPEARAPEASGEAPARPALTEADVAAMNRIPQAGTDAGSVAFRAQADQGFPDGDFLYARAGAKGPPSSRDVPKAPAREPTTGTAEEVPAPSRDGPAGQESAEVREVERLLESARAAKERAYEHYTRLVTTGGEGDVEEARDRYREAKQLVDRLEAQLEEMRR